MMLKPRNSSINRVGANGANIHINRLLSNSGTKKLGMQPWKFVVLQNHPIMTYDHDYTITNQVCPFCLIRGPAAVYGQEPISPVHKLTPHVSSKRSMGHISQRMGRDL